MIDITLTRAKANIEVNFKWKAPFDEIKNTRAVKLRLLKPHVDWVTLECRRCSNIIGTYDPIATSIIKLHECPVCVAEVTRQAIAYVERKNHPQMELPFE